MTMSADDAPVGNHGNVWERIAPDIKAQEANENARENFDLRRSGIVWSNMHVRPGISEGRRGNILGAENPAFIARRRVQKIGRHVAAFMSFPQDGKIHAQEIKGLIAVHPAMKRVRFEYDDIVGLVRYLSYRLTISADQL
jgi:hypothetical protein